MSYKKKQIAAFTMAGIMATSVTTPAFAAEATATCSVTLSDGVIRHNVSNIQTLPNVEYTATWNDLTQSFELNDVEDGFFLLSWDDEHQTENVANVVVTGGVAVATLVCPTVDTNSLEYNIEDGQVKFSFRTGGTWPGEAPSFVFKNNGFEVQAEVQVKDGIASGTAVLSPGEYTAHWFDGQKDFVFKNQVVIAGETEEEGPTGTSDLKLSSTDLDFKDGVDAEVNIEKPVDRLDLTNCSLSTSDKKKLPPEGLVINEMFAAMGLLVVNWDGTSPMPNQIVLWDGNAIVGTLTPVNYHGQVVPDKTVELTITPDSTLIFPFAYDKLDQNSVDRSGLVLSIGENTDAADIDLSKLSFQEAGLTIQNPLISGKKISMEVSGAYEQIKDLTKATLLYDGKLVGTVDLNVIVSGKPSVNLGEDKILDLVYPYDSTEVTTASDTIDLKTAYTLNANKFELNGVTGAVFAVNGNTLTITLKKSVSAGDYALSYDGEILGNIEVKQRIEEIPNTSISIKAGESLSYEFEYHDEATKKKTATLGLEITNPKGEVLTKEDFSLKILDENGNQVETSDLVIESFDPETKTLTISAVRGVEGSPDIMSMYLYFRDKAVNQDPVYTSIIIRPNPDPALVESVHSTIVYSYDKDHDGRPDAELSYRDEYATDDYAKAAFIQKTVQNWVDQVSAMEGYENWAGVKVQVTYDADNKQFKSVVTMRGSTSTAAVWNVTMKAKPVEDKLPSIDLAEIVMNRTGTKELNLNFGSGTVAANKATITTADGSIVTMDKSMVSATDEVKKIVLTGAKKGETTITVTFDDAAKTTFTLPIKVHALTYTIQTSMSTNGKITTTLAGFDGVVEEGSKITFTFTPDSGYKVDEVLIDGVSKGAITSYTFENIQENHKVYAKFEKVSSGSGGSSSGGGSSGGGSSSGSSSSSNRKPSVSHNKGGSVTVLKDNRTCVITPDKGYVIEDVIVNGKSIGAVDEYKFKTASRSNKLKVVFAKAENPENKPPAVPERPNTPSKFDDINGHWAENAIRVFEKAGWVSGISETKFAPNMTMTRGMFVTILGRMDGATPEKTCSFDDVSKTAYYAGYVEWAKNNGIANGIGNNQFAPDRSISRQEMCVMVANYMTRKGYPFKNRSVKPFADDAKIGQWAKKAVYQLASDGIVSGYGENVFGAHDTATRAQLVMILYRAKQKML